MMKISETDSSEGRIWFAGNPWPEGHPIKEFEWYFECRDEMVWMFMRLETADYDAEHDGVERSDRNQMAWEVPAVWKQHGNCTLSGDSWRPGGFPLCPLKAFSACFLNGHEMLVDPLPIPPQKKWDDMAFAIHLLGDGDLIADNRFAFVKRKQSNRFDIFWAGQVALAHSGERYRHKFRAEIFDLELPDTYGGDQQK